MPTTTTNLLSRLLLGLTLGGVLLPAPGQAQEARRRYERSCQIRHEKFDRILPEAMRENDVDLWIIVMREGLLDPLWQDLGGGYVGGWAYWIFADRGGDRIERIVLGAGGYSLQRCGVYDRFGATSELKAIVSERNPARIAVNMSADIGLADGLSHTSYQHLVTTLGEPFAARLVSAEKLFSDFRSRHTATEIAAMGEAGEISRVLAERAFSNEVITPGVTTLEDVAWWMWDQLLQRGLGSSFDMPSVYITGPDGIEATSSSRIIQRGDLLMIDWGVGFLGQWTDMKRIAYVLREGETEAPASFRRAFENGVRVRDIMRRTIRPGRTAQPGGHGLHLGDRGLQAPLQPGETRQGALGLGQQRPGVGSAGGVGHRRYRARSRRPARAARRGARRSTRRRPGSYRGPWRSLSPPRGGRLPAPVRERPGSAPDHLGSRDRRGGARQRVGGGP